MDYFDLLGLERRVALGEDEVQGAFHVLSRERHPDVGGGEGEFEIVTEGYAVLRDPVRRLRHFLELEFEEGKEEGRQMISGELLELFGKVGEGVQRSDEFLKRKAASRTALGRAVLAKEETTRQRELADLAAVLAEARENAEARFDEVDDAMAAGERERARKLGVELAERMSYLSKWTEQVREKFAAFI